MDTDDTYRICIIVPQGNPHVACFAEVALLLEHSFLSLGISCDIALNDLAEDRINIILGANLLNPDTFSPAARFVIYQLEQLSDSEGWYSDAKMGLFRKADAVWDYSKENIAFLQSHGVEASHLPLGYHPALEQIQIQDDREIDVLFFGSRNQRRNAVLEKLHKKGVSVKALFGVYGKDRDAFIARSRSIINIHFYSATIFEAVRISYLLNNRCFVISEESSVYPYHGVSLPLVPYDSLIDTCMQYCKQPEEIERLRQQMYEEFKTLYPMESLLKKIV